LWCAQGIKFVYDHFTTEIRIIKRAESVLNYILHYTETFLMGSYKSNLIGMENLTFIITETPDQEELIQFMQGIDTVPNKERYVKTVLSVMKYHIIAFLEEKMMGWIAMIEVNPATMYFFEWHPFVLSHPQQDKIKQKLLLKAFHLTKKLNIPNLRTFVDVENPNSEEFRELEKTYLATEMIKTHIQDCMECQITEKNRKDLTVPPELIVSDLNSEKREILLKSYEITFKDSFDDFIASLDDFERKEWDLFGEDQLKDVAIVLKNSDGIIGFIGVRDEGEYVDIGPVGILPEFRGKKLGSFLIESTFQKLLAQGKTNIYLDVGNRNKVAYNLYYKHGFRKVSEKHGFLMKLK
jgi:ribosomal protein S18 acetylase RimI-like enzyme